jgi:hypothetical protein
MESAGLVQSLIQQSQHEQDGQSAVGLGRPLMGWRLPLLAKEDRTRFGQPDTSGADR